MSQSLARPNVLKLKPYVPGKPIEETEREYGVRNIIKLASNENSLGPSPLAVAAMKAAAEQVGLYPDAACFALTRRCRSTTSTSLSGTMAEHLRLW